MIPVTRYQCEYCKKEFKTPNRHYCKFDPKLKNCLSCKHMNGWEYVEDEWGRTIEGYPYCKHGSDAWDLSEMRYNGFNMQCNEWEPKKKAE